MLRVLFRLALLENCNFPAKPSSSFAGKEREREREREKRSAAFGVGVGVYILASD